ncbi:hypothetical protein RXV86_15310 [Alisedimentitalea sp. MJ-SS2]|uniref:hypothetical protein n=1 Tax=Aliisedimentitalea sp. MJ-SS2 TaxID=3049795 RepID=UPI00290E04BA|nr:hypothetical protein [Alisedimentitalea sp. MJ-SS2]MDU8928759.1 hypothetical protein [Alisedimentitalea sp. MJ-SS2]
MLSTLILVKVMVTLVVVVGLTLIAEHVSARLAGILAGFPHGIAIVLYFIGLEHGAVFAATAAVAAVGGLTANLAHAMGIALLAPETKGWRGAMMAASGGIAVFLIVAGLLRLLAPGAGWGAVITGLAITAAWVGMRHWQEHVHVAKPRTTMAELALRAAVAAGIVITITALAGVIGPVWAGLLSGFPVVTFPVLLLVQARHGHAPVIGMVKAYPFGLTALIVYTLTVSVTFPLLGIGWGTAAGLLASLLWMSLATTLRAQITKGS